MSGKAEAALWRYLQPMLAAHGHFVRVENPIDPGTPDVNFCVNGQEGWLELKALAAWPRRSTSPVGPRLVRPAQRVWWAKRVHQGGRVFVLLRVGLGASATSLFFPAFLAWTNLGTVNQAELLDLAQAVWTGPIDAERLARRLGDQP